MLRIKKKQLTIHLLWMVLLLRTTRKNLTVQTLRGKGGRILWGNVRMYHEWVWVPAYVENGRFMYSWSFRWVSAWCLRDKG